MKLVKGGTYQIVDIPEAEDCLECKPCIRLRMMEIGFICGELIKIKLHQHGIYLVSVLTNSGEECQTIALRDEEANRIIFKEIEIV